MLWVSRHELSQVEEIGETLGVLGRCGLWPRLLSLRGGHDDIHAGMVSFVGRPFGAVTLSSIELF